MLYAYSSGTGNNGSAFAGLTANPTSGDAPHYNVTLGLATLLGRFIMIVPILALAGSLAKKKLIPVSAGSFPVAGGTFVVLLVGTILIVGALTFLPALALGPIVEHFLMHAGGPLYSLRRRSCGHLQSPRQIAAADRPCSVLWISFDGRLASLSQGAARLPELSFSALAVSSAMLMVFAFMQPGTWPLGFVQATLTVGSIATLAQSRRVAAEAAGIVYDKTAVERCTR